MAQLNLKLTFTISPALQEARQRMNDLLAADMAKLNMELSETITSAFDRLSERLRDSLATDMAQLQLRLSDRVMPALEQAGEQFTSLANDTAKQLESVISRHPPADVMNWCQAHNYTEPFFQEGAWWGYPPHGVIPIQLELSDSELNHG